MPRSTPGRRRRGSRPAAAEALEARRRYHELLEGLRPGPVRDRLARTGEGLDARLGAAVAQAAEVALDVAGPSAADALDAELAGVVDELATLRSALDDLG